MINASWTLTVLFEDPFWVGIAEVEDEEGYRAAKQVFGAEPADPEVMEFVLRGWGRLRFSVAKREGSSRELGQIGYKRRLRMAKKEVVSSRGTKAQQAIQEQRELAAQNRKSASKERQEREKQNRFEQRCQKRKQKRRGH